MKRLPRIVSAEPVIHGVLKIVWNDGYEGVVDLSPDNRSREDFHLFAEAQKLQESEGR